MVAMEVNNLVVNNSDIIDLLLVWCKVGFLEGGMFADEFRDKHPPGSGLNRPWTP